MNAIRWCALGLVAIGSTGVADAAQTKAITAYPRGETPIVIDGILDEAAWAEAPTAGAFVEREPNPGSSPPVTTEFKVLYDDETIYVAVIAYLDPNETPRALELQRDTFSIFSDDAISLKFDARLDQRTTVGFVTNPAGAQLDYIVANNGEFRREFDAIWNVATRVEDDRWIAEFEIPSVALGLAGDDGNRTIGLNVTRDHNHQLATYDWNEIPPQFGPTSALFYGRVEGLIDVAGGKTLTLIPYVLGGYTNVDDEGFEGKVGGDIRYRLTDDAWTELTLLTDFAQVDLDNPVLNLNRFPLFFNERRPFFLTGVDVFEFGVGGFVQPFFTRRIGLDADNNIVPLLGGFKIYGSTGNLRFGVLEVITGEKDSAPAENFTVARARYNWSDRGHLGVIATFNGEVSRRPNAEANPIDPSFSVGIDGSVLAFDSKLELSGFWTGSQNAVDTDTLEGHAGRAAAVWRGDELMPSFAVTFISDDYDPLVGFVSRQNLLQSRVELPWISRINRVGLRSVTIGAVGQIEHDFPATFVLGQQGTGYFTLVFDNAWSLGSGATAKEDFVTEAFEIVPGRDVAVGLYRGLEADIVLEAPSGRNPSGSIQYLINTALFGGTLHSFRANAAVRLGPHFNASVEADYSIISFDDFETTNTFIASGALHIAPSTKLAIDLIGQGNALNETAAALVRIRWRYLPGSDLFFVYRENIDFAGDNDGRSLALKIAFRYDAVL